MASIVSQASSVCSLRVTFSSRDKNTEGVQHYRSGIVFKINSRNALSGSAARANSSRIPNNGLFGRFTRFHLSPGKLPPSAHLTAG